MKKNQLNKQKTFSQYPRNIPDKKIFCFFVFSVQVFYIYNLIIHISYFDALTNSGTLGNPEPF